ncbi:MAG TPA: NADH-quinone oxidoreductase subunit C [Acidimicrobiales bacterium]|nr:NADH-quinone oxidoreductase subunit C [Acidimicrobiales bacterium]
MSSAEPPAGDATEGTADDERAAAGATDEPAAAAATDEPAAVAATDDTGDATPGPLPDGPPVDDGRLVVLDALTAELGAHLVTTETHRDDIWVRVTAKGWKRAAEVCRSLGFDYFCFLSGLDWMPSVSVMRGEVTSEVAEGETDEAEAVEQAEAAYPAAAGAEPDSAETGSAGTQPDGETGTWKTGHAGGDTRFQVFARLYSIERHIGLTLKADLDDDAPAVETWSQVYPGADWHERETWEMFGFDFIGHPHLVHLYLPGEFEGFPLRKDFPLLAREVKPWPGLVDVEPMPGTEEDATPEQVSEQG